MTSLEFSIVALVAAVCAVSINVLLPMYQEHAWRKKWKGLKREPKPMWPGVDE